MKRHKASDLSGLVAEMIQTAGDIGTQWILGLCIGIVEEGCIPEDWKSTVVLPVSSKTGCDGMGMYCIKKIMIE